MPHPAAEVLPILQRCGLLVLALMMGGCGHVLLENKSYTGGEAVELNGARVRSAVKPNGGKEKFAFSAMVYSAGSATLDGPFLWRIEAEGVEEVHEGLTVHRLKITTEKTRRSEWYPRNYLGVEVPFRAKRGESGQTFAQYQIPGELEVYPDKDGEIVLQAEISVRSVYRAERRIVHFRLSPESSRGMESFSVPAEIAKSFRGPDPTDWKVKPGSLFSEEEGW